MKPESSCWCNAVLTYLVLPAGNGDTLGFVARFFDRNCVGTLERDDIEDIAFMTAPPISRAYS